MERSHLRHALENVLVRSNYKSPKVSVKIKPVSIDLAIGVVPAQIHSGVRAELWCVHEGFYSAKKRIVSKSLLPVGFNRSSGGVGSIGRELFWSGRDVRPSLNVATRQPTAPGCVLCGGIQVRSIVFQRDLNFCGRKNPSSRHNPATGALHATLQRSGSADTRGTKSAHAKTKKDTLYWSTQTCV